MINYNKYLCIIIIVIHINIIITISEAKSKIFIQPSKCDQFMKLTVKQSLHMIHDFGVIDYDYIQQDIPVLYFINSTIL